MADGKNASFKGRNSFTSKKLGFGSKLDGSSSPLSPGEADAEGEPWGAGGTGGGGAGPQRKLPPRSKSRFGRLKGGSDDEGGDDGLDLSDGDMEAGGGDSTEAESQLKSVPSIATDDFISYSTKAKKKKGDISSLGGKSFTKLKKMMAAKPGSDGED
eukprot:TRINITY_DN8089_c0_g1_i1.p2 TRINITY_DN8089_c0_g1~~TRINITY_DN8089_c0_g1_i1.p2  ORF type:complete len:157 (+),score=66.63 TRINITY_DN8089_c0_g1_i1:387-857(+)